MTDEELEQARSKLYGKFSKREVEIVEHVTKTAFLVERSKILAWCEENAHVVDTVNFAVVPYVYLSDLKDYLGRL